VAAKLFGLLVFGAISLVFAAWTVRDLRRGETIIVPMEFVSRSDKPILFWLQIVGQGLLAAAGLFGFVWIALA
jgi:hypothetical protein